MLLSGPSTYEHPDGNPQPVAPATMDNVRIAFDRWHDRCDADPENVAVFYFCGHGIEADTLALLMEDFGKRPKNPWTQAMGFSLTRLGMTLCQAKTQFYFIDACRSVPRSVLAEQGVISGEAFLVGQLS
jgi:hypothetical protein